MFLRVVFFQILWFLLVSNGLSEANIFFPIIAFFVVVIDYRYFYKEMEWKKFLVFTSFTLLIGFIVDFGLLKIQTISFSQNWSKLQPPSMLALWVIFIPYFDLFAKKKIFTIRNCFFFGLLLAPFSYKGGESFGFLKVQGYSGMIMIGLFWSCAFPLLMVFYRYCRSFDSSEKSES